MAGISARHAAASLPPSRAPPVRVTAAIASSSPSSSSCISPAPSTTSLASSSSMAGATAAVPRGSLCLTSPGSRSRGSTGLGLKVLLAFSVLATAALANERSRTSTMWAETFYRPQEGELGWVGVTNEDTSYLGTRYGILQKTSSGNLEQMVRVDDGEIRAWHLCHSRQSLFYEVLSKDKTMTTIFEHPISTINSRQEATVKVFSDMHPAASLACVDGYLLRASPSLFLAIDLDTQEISYLIKEKEDNIPEERPPVLTSLTVAYEEDVVANAKVFAICPENQTIVRLGLQHDGSSRKLTLTNLPEAIPARASNPEQLVWAHDQLFYTDGCMVRSWDFGHKLETILGEHECTTAHDENISGVPWAARLSRPKALAVAAQGTKDLSLWVVTEAQVVRVYSRPDVCARHSSNDGDCRDQAGCAWAEGDGSQGAARCFACDELVRWTKKNGLEDHCAFKTTMPEGTQCDLQQCGCPEVATFAPFGWFGRQAPLSTWVGAAACVAFTVALAVYFHHRYKKREAYLTVNAEQTSQAESNYDYERLQGSE